MASHRPGGEPGSMALDNGQIIRNAYQIAEVKDIAGARPE
jgi:hypothetical protein